MTALTISTVLTWFHKQSPDRRQKGSGVHSKTKLYFRLSYPPFLNRQGERRAIISTWQDWFQIREQRLHLLGSAWEQTRDMLFVSYRNISAALSLLYKVYNSIYSQSWYLDVMQQLRYLILFCSYAAPLHCTKAFNCLFLVTNNEPAKPISFL